MAFSIEKGTSYNISCKIGIIPTDFIDSKAYKEVQRRKEYLHVS